MRKIYRAAVIMFGLGLAAAAFCTCSDTVAPTDALTRRIESQTYTYHLSPGDWVDTTWQESYHHWLSEALAIATVGKIHYYKYRDRGQKLQLTGVDGNGIAYPEMRELHTIWPSDNHEVVHVVVGDALGLSIPLFGEGVAVAHSVNPSANDYVPRWGSPSVHEIARVMWQNGTVPPLSDLIQSPSRFRSYPESTTYPLAGSFVRYLIDTRGIAALKQFLAASRVNDAASVTLTGFKAAYGEELPDVWQQWRLSLQ